MRLSCGCEDAEGGGGHVSVTMTNVESSAATARNLAALVRIQTVISSSSMTTASLLSCQISVPASLHCAPGSLSIHCYTNRSGSPAMHVRSAACRLVRMPAALTSC